MKLSTFTAFFPGLALAAVIALVARFLGGLLPLVGGPVFALVIGALAGSLGRRPACLPGRRLASKGLLQLAVALLGFGLDFGYALRVGGSSLVVMAVTVASSFLAAFLVSRALRIGGKSVSLIAIGTAICGASAIVAASPAMEASEEETAYAISTIFAFNIAAVLVFPPLGRALGLSDAGFGVWAGTAVNDTSSVVAAGLAYSQAALETATVVKLTRTLLIVPVVFVLSARTARAAGREGRAAGRRGSAFPWFVLGFVAASAAGSLGVLPANVARVLAETGKALILVAMAAIGMGVEPRSVAAAGWKPLVLGLACWFAVSASSLGVQAALGRW